MKPITISMAGGKPAKGNYVSYFSYNKQGEIYNICVKGEGPKIPHGDYSTIEVTEYGFKDSTLFVYKYKPLAKVEHAALKAHFETKQANLEDFINNL